MRKSDTRCCVLVVDDNDNFRETISEYLKSQGFCVLEAANGVEAVALFRQNQSRVDVLLTDVRMPCMTGDNLVKYLKGTNPTVRAIYMSAFPSSLNSKAEEQGFPFWLQKPFSLTLLPYLLRNCGSA